ncbi:MAG: MATE family efflux transporter [Planctomycetota bacterium]
MSALDLTHGSVGRHVRDLAAPASIGWFFQTMYNVVDSFYGGRISTQALAAMALSFPVFLMMIAAASGLSRATSALVANAIGEHDDDKKNRLILQAASLGLWITIGLTTFGLAVQRPLFEVLGATGDYLELSVDYMTPIFLGSIFFVGTGLCNSILVAHGDSKTFGMVLIAGFFLNLIFDPWFLYGGYGVPAMGLAGIAWATVIIQSFGFMFMVSTVLRRRLVTLESSTELIPDLAVYKDLLVQGIPASFNTLSVAIGFFSTTYFLQVYGDATVAAFGVTTRIEQIALLPTFGLSTAIMALVGQNNGARKYDRIRQTMKVCILAGFALALLTSTIIFIFAESVFGLFTEDPEVLEIGVYYARIMMTIQWAFVMTSAHIAFLQAIKRPMYGFFETIFRKLIIPIPMIYAVVILWKWPVEYVWYSMVITVLVMTAVTVLYAQTKLRTIDQNVKVV